MGQTTSQPALTVKGFTPSLVVQETTCTDALQPSLTRVTRAISTYRMPERFWELQTIAIRATFSSIENYRTPGKFLESTESEFDQLFGMHELFEHPGGSVKKAII